MSRLSLFVGFAAVVMLTLSCGPSQPKAAGGRVPAKSISGPGVAQGKVMIKDPPAPLPPLKNEPCCEGAPATVPDESIVVNDNGTLANVVVFIQGGPKAEGSDLDAAKLDQVFCRYTPHVIGVVVGQTLNIKSSDPTVHNVHYKSTFGGDSNYWMKNAGESVDVKFKMPEFIRTGCDVHPWMNATICVLDNPLFAITGSDGTFKIPNLPTGSYKLVAWHERFGKMEQPLEIKDEAPVTVDFTFAPQAK